MLQDCFYENGILKLLEHCHKVKEKILIINKYMY